MKNQITMKEIKQIGIWMDHASADIIEMNSETIDSSIVSNFTFDVKVEALSRNENLMHNKEQQLHNAYYKELADKILSYEHVLLFGPTKAKSELYDLLLKDLHFKDIQIDLKTTDKLTDGEKKAFVQNHFK